VSGSKNSQKPHGRLSAFARGLLREWRRLALPPADAAVIVGVSGGADSVALVRALAELAGAKKVNVEIVVAHLNHKLRGAASNADARWVAAFAKELGYPVVLKTADIKKRAQESKDNLEQAARRARYEFFATVAKSHRATFVLTAHTMNDQAETVLLNLIRGSGSDGLSGIEPRRPLSADSNVVLARPLVSWARRQDTEDYCRLNSVDYRQDEMNFDDSFSRVRVRKELLPLLEELNPRFVESVVRNSELLRDDSAALNLAASALLDPTDTRSGEQALRTAPLRAASAGLRRRALRLWLMKHRGDLRRIEQAHILAIEKLLFSQKSGRMIELPGGGAAFRQDGMLHFRARGGK
jgi:tRNA(Ile)-lysidine synthase